MLVKAADGGLAAGGEGARKAGVQDRWFSAYVAKEKPRKTFEVGEVERVHGIELPASYKEFCAKVGERVFKDVDEEPGFTAQIGRIKKVECAVKWVEQEGEDGKIWVFHFAGTDHGDEFVFDLTEGKADTEVLLYLHERGVLSRIRKFCGVRKAVG